MNQPNQLTTRRDFLKLSGFIGALTALSACNAQQTAAAATSTPILTSSLTVLPNDEDWLIYQTLQRITFGPRVDEIARAQEIGLDAFIEEQLAPESIDDSAMDSLLDGMDTLEMGPDELLEVEKRGQPVNELIRATLLRAVFSKRQLYELMVDFWSNHFNLYVRKSQVGLLKIIDDRQVIRPNVLGRFHDILSASAHSPAMLVYLDNAQSSREHPNENYARELLELHTLGVDGGYRHEDITEVARALTGWSVSNLRDENPGYFQYRARMHDDDEKSILGTSFPAGQGIGDGEQLLELLAGHSSTAQFISEKLVRRFVADDPRGALVTQAAETFTRTNGDIRAVMSVILHSQEFKNSLGMKLKRPFEYIVSALRTTQARAEIDRFTGLVLAQMGQPLFHWSPPDGYPDYAEAWATTNGMLSRWNYALALAFNAARDSEVDWNSLTGGAAIPEALDTISDHLLGGALSDEARQIVLDFANGLNTEMAIPAMGALLLASPAFQYR